MSTEMQNSNAYIQQSEVPNVETLTKVQMAYLTDANSALHEAGHLAGRHDSPVAPLPPGRPPFSLSCFSQRLGETGGFRRDA